MLKKNRFLVKNARICDCGDKRVVCIRVYPGKPGSAYRCVCHGCGVYSPYRNTLEKAISVWNGGSGGSDPLGAFTSDELMEQVIDIFSGIK